MIGIREVLRTEISAKRNRSKIDRVQICSLTLQKRRSRRMQWLRESREMTAEGGQFAFPHGKKIVLFHSPEMKQLAEEILQLPGNQALLFPGQIEWKNFEDGFPNLFINNVDTIRGRHVVFLASFLNPSSLLAQLAGRLPLVSHSALIERA
jgi:hypothetical protein